MNYNATAKQIIPKVTALWAFSESGLGGLMHAIRMPFSGIFLGSISVILITFLAYNSQQKWKVIIQAMTLVLILKATISPYSPIMAYAAVGFQGILGALLYQFFGVQRWTAICFGMIALLESAFQKVLTLTIFFGVELWEAIQSFFDGLTQSLKLPFLETIPSIALVSYGILYASVGVMAGIFAFKLPRNIEKKVIELQTIVMENPNFDLTVTKKPQRSKKLWIGISLLLFILTMLVFTGKSKDIWYILLRTLAVLLVFIYVVNPLATFLLKRWARNNKKHYQARLTEVMEFIPQIRKNTSVAHQLTKHISNPVKRGKQFLLTWFAMSIYFDTP